MSQERFNWCRQVPEMCWVAQLHPPGTVKLSPQSALMNVGKAVGMLSLPCSQGGKPRTGNRAWKCPVGQEMNPGVPGNGRVK